jgi:hypothetical protein
MVLQFVKDAIDTYAPRLMESEPVRYAADWFSKRFTVTAVKQTFYTLVAQQIGVQNYIDQLVNYLVADRIQEMRWLDYEIRLLSGTNPNRIRFIGALVDRFMAPMYTDQQIAAMSRRELLRAWREREAIPSKDADIPTDTEVIRARVASLQQGHVRVTYGLLFAGMTRLMGKAGTLVLVKVLMAEQTQNYIRATLAFIRDATLVTAAGLRTAGVKALEVVLTTAPQALEFAKLLSQGCGNALTNLSGPDTVPAPIAEAVQAANKIDVFKGIKDRQLPAELMNPFRLDVTPALKSDMSMTQDMLEKWSIDMVKERIGPEAWRLSDYEFLPLGDALIMKGAKYGVSTAAGTIDAAIRNYNDLGDTLDTASHAGAFIHAVSENMHRTAPPVTGWKSYLPRWYDFLPKRVYNHISIPNSAVILQGVETSLRVDLRQEMMKSFLQFPLDTTAAMKDLVKRASLGTILPSVFDFFRMRHVTTDADMELVRNAADATRVPLSAQDAMNRMAQNAFDAIRQANAPPPTTQRPINAEMMPERGRGRRRRRHYHGRC